MTQSVSEAEAQVRAARETLADLINKRAAADCRFVELDAERTRVSFAAHTGEPRARKALDDVLKVMSRHDGETKSLDAAVAEAQRRVADAEAVQARAQEADNAGQALALLAEFRQHGAQLDESAKALLAQYDEFKSCAR